MSDDLAPEVFVVRAESGQFAGDFLERSYIGIGWLRYLDLSEIADKEELRAAMQAAYPEASTMELAQKTGQVWRFLQDVQPGSIVITPTEDSDRLIVGRVVSDYYFKPDADGSPYPHRREMKWQSGYLLRSGLSIPLQHSLRAALTVFAPRNTDQVYKHLGLEVVGKEQRLELTAAAVKKEIIARILELTAEEFEVLVQQLLVAIGFDAQHVGRVGDGGVDVTGELQVYNFASIKIKVQVKRYNVNHLVDQHTIRGFRAVVPDKFQAAFVTTSDYNRLAREEAVKADFKRIGLINGSQLVDILIEHYDDLADDPHQELGLSIEAIKQKLSLRHALIPE